MNIPTTIQVQLSYSDIFPDEETPDIKDLISEFPRNLCIEAFLQFRSEFINKPLSEIAEKLTGGRKSPFFKRILKRSEEVCKERINSPLTNQTDFSRLVTYQTMLEFLQYTFAYTKNEGTCLNADIVLEKLIRILLAINEQIFKLQLSRDNIDVKLNSIEQSVLVNQFSQYSLTYEYQKALTMSETYKFCQLINFCNDNKIFKFSLDEYIKSLGLKAPQLLAYKYFILNHIFSANPNDTLLLTPQEAPLQSIQLDEIIATDKNKDYQAFREKPFVSLGGGYYFAIHSSFISQKIFTSVVFGIKNFFEARDSFWPKFCKYFTEEYLCYPLLKRIANSIHADVAISGDHMEKEKDGYPDYYIRSRNTILLFEIKDSKISSRDRISHEFAEINNTLKSKYIAKTGKNGKQKLFGIHQIINNAERILNNNFYFDHAYNPKKVTIYPILVSGDYQSNLPGFNNYMNTEFQEALKKKGLKGSILPLTIVDINTLIVFLRYFEKGSPSLPNGLRGYHRHIREHKSRLNTFDDIISSNISLQEYLFWKYGSPNNKLLFEEIKPILFTDELRTKGYVPKLGSQSTEC